MFILAWKPSEFFAFKRLFKISFLSASVPLRQNENFAFSINFS